MIVSILAAALVVTGLTCTPPTFTEKDGHFTACRAHDAQTMTCETANDTTVMIDLTAVTVVGFDPAPNNLDAPAYVRESLDTCVWTKQYARGHAPQES